MRELARAAGVSHATLVRARAGDFELSPERVRSLVAVLREWGSTCAHLADELESALESVEEDADG